MLGTYPRATTYCLRSIGFEPLSLVKRNIKCFCRVWEVTSISSPSGCSDCLSISVCLPVAHLRRLLVSYQLG